MSEENTERLSTSLPPELKQQVRIEAAKQGMTMSEYVRSVLEDEFGESDEDSDESEDESGNPKPAATFA